MHASVWHRGDVKGRRPSPVVFAAMIVVAVLPLVLEGCASERFSSETCRQERYRSKQTSRSSFCSVQFPDRRFVHDLARKAADEAASSTAKDSWPSESAHRARGSTLWQES